ncbi:hypothetical protein QOT17_005036 [Balamuthia mandrillaris]
MLQGHNQTGAVTTTGVCLARLLGAMPKRPTLSTAVVGMEWLVGRNATTRHVSSSSSSSSSLILASPPSSPPTQLFKWLKHEQLPPSKVFLRVPLHQRRLSSSSSSFSSSSSLFLSSSSPMSRFKRVPVPPSGSSQNFLFRTGRCLYSTSSDSSDQQQQQDNTDVPETKQEKKQREKAAFKQQLQEKEWWQKAPPLPWIGEKGDELFLRFSSKLPPKIKRLVDEYGWLAIYTHMTLSFGVFAALVALINVGVDVSQILIDLGVPVSDQTLAALESEKGHKASVFGLAFIVNHIIVPIRLVMTATVTPLTAKFLRYRKRLHDDEDGPEEVPPPQQQP